MCKYSYKKNRFLCKKKASRTPHGFNSEAPEPAKFNLAVASASLLAYKAAVKITFVNFHVVAKNFFVALKPRKVSVHRALVGILAGLVKLRPSVWHLLVGRAQGFL